MTQFIPPSAEELKFIDFVEFYWWDNREYPTANTIAVGLGLPVGDVKEIQDRPAVKRMLKHRGIEIFDPDAGSFSTEQVSAAFVFLNVADTRRLDVKLAEIGVTPTEFAGWQKNRRYARFLREQTEAHFDDAMAYAHMALMQKVMQGDMKAITLFYQISDRYTGPQNNEQQNVGLLMTKLLEVIQRNVEDPVILEKMGNELQAIASGGEIKSPVKAYAERVLERGNNPG